MPIVSVVLLGKLPSPERHSARIRFPRETFCVNCIFVTPTEFSPVDVAPIKVIAPEELPLAVVPDATVDDAEIFPTLSCAVM